MNDFITWDRVIRLLDIDNNELRDLIAFSNLSVYSAPIYEYDVGFDKMPPSVVKLKEFTTDWPGSLDDIKAYYRFLKEDVEVLIENPRADSLSGKERRELGRLRREKENLDFIIKASVCSGLFCQKMSRSVTKDELKNELIRECGGEPTDPIFRKIWKSLPAEYKKSAGRPKK